MFSIMAVSLYITTSSVQVFPFSISSPRVIIYCLFFFFFPIQPGTEAGNVPGSSGTSQEAGVGQESGSSETNVESGYMEPSPALVQAAQLWGKPEPAGAGLVLGGAEAYHMRAYQEAGSTEALHQGNNSFIM